jgi:hypothetical protein
MPIFPLGLSPAAAGAAAAVFVFVDSDADDVELVRLVEVADEEEEEVTFEVILKPRLNRCPLYHPFPSGVSPVGSRSSRQNPGLISKFPASILSFSPIVHVNPLGSATSAI